MPDQSALPGFKNPILPGFYPDPSICRVDDDYFLVCSSFEYFPGVPLFHSRDLLTWTQIGHCLTRTTQLDLTHIANSQGIYAPTLRYNAGRYYMITTCVGSAGHFFVTAVDPWGEWSEPVFVKGDGDGSGHDPDLFFDEDGSVYYTRFTWDRSIVQWPINLTTGVVQGEGHTIWRGFEDRFCEAPHIYKHNGFYYLIAAEGGTGRGHMIVAARSDKPGGPYLACPTNPILSHRALVLEPIQATGHGDLVCTADGSWWIVFLAIRAVFEGQFHNLGRETFLAPVSWGDEGWPVIHDKQPITEHMQVAHLPHPHGSQSWQMEDFHESFQSGQLGYAWSHRSISTHEEGAVTDWLGVRQRHTVFRATVKLSVNRETATQEVGMSILANDRHHYDVAIRHGELIVRLCVGDLSSIIASTRLYSEQVTLCIEGNPTEYKLGYIGEDGSDCFMGRGRSRYLSTEVVGGFTGAFVGLYVTGCEPDIHDHFQSFLYHPIEESVLVPVAGTPPEETSPW